MNGPYHRQHPFLASLKERYPLSKPGSQKNTHHLILDIKGSGITYEVGDSVGIFPRHEAELVEKTLQVLQATGQELIRLKSIGEFIPIGEFLATRANISDISPKLFREVSIRQTSPHKKLLLEELQQESHHEAFKAYVEKHEVWDFLLAHSEVLFTPQELVDLLMPLLPRFYSISSSQKCVGDEVHLIVTPLHYESNGQKRRGVCTHYLCELAELHCPNIPMFVQPAHSFRLPKNLSTDVIMIGPGTGVAPFRAFLQERISHYRAKGRHWLFFGEWNRAYDFFYKEEWLEFAERGHLRLDLAFSRDQAHKVYVQHKMWEKGEEFYRWLEQGAYLYVCGNAQYMAKDVDKILHAIIKEFGRKEDLQVKEYIKSLRQQKRYLRDIY